MSCFYTVKNKLSVKEIKKAILITSVSKRIKYLAVNVTIEEGLYLQNYDIQIKETEDDVNKWKDVLWSHRLEGLILLKWLYYTRQFTGVIQFLPSYQ